jgi:chitin disaccharide deacetylase
VRRLIINADDFGLTHGVNQAIAELHRASVLTSTTLMAREKATDEAIEIALATPSLGVGCHVVLVGGESVLPGGFQLPMGTFLRRALTGRIDSAAIEAEAGAQINLLQNRGLTLTHIDTHKHTHMFPAVLRPVLRAARNARIRAVRNPFEPAWSLRATLNAPWIRRNEVWLLRRLEPTFRRIAAEEGFTTTDGCLGISATGSLDSETLSSLLNQLRPGTWELVTHPGYNDADLAAAGTRLLASRETEREALASINQRNQIELINFSSLGRG